ncbi:GMC oxidoreductase [Chelativorans salis]|uniref:GMC family oxidoreductase n=1 Tax=Chelativorans salis TaxID=2978478 RepID=A0ABT2LLW7_9HYPH|nr:GMC family oxidoreductase [Chelativorans sp. EGI FJ00035]MCT7375575.1 GMC family oxidoreductase [Chelativorans sp. EGI FJ00035]
MKILDLQSMQAGTTLRVDLAIVGAGPAGLTIARELANTKIRVLVLESGGADFEPRAQALNEVDSIGEPVKRATAAPSRGYTDELSWLNDIPAFELRNRIVGGSTHTWIGKCAAFDEVDFAERHWVPGSGWPIARESLAGALDRAAVMLNLGPNVYDEGLYSLLSSPPADLRINRELLRPFFWQFSHSHERAGPLRFGDEIGKLDAPNIEILTNATVTHLNTDETGHRVVSLGLRSLDGAHASVRADMVVLGAGGIENPRLLLASGGIGNRHGIVGRYLADHPRAVITRFGKEQAAAIARHFGFYGLALGSRTQFYLHGLSLSPQLQEREGLLNCAAYPVQELAEDDPWLALKHLSRRRGGNRMRHAWRALSSPGLLAAGLHRRLVLKRGLPRRLEGIRFDTMVEQRPNAESRVTLSDRLDRLGMPLASVDWRISPQEVASVARLAELMSAEFERVGLPEPRLADWILRNDPAGAAFSDMAHPACTTRMGRDPATSVVDENARVHGMEGLYIAGSSVFPTAGHANPTLMIVALAIRLADHLKDQFDKGSHLRPKRERLVRAA